MTDHTGGEIHQMSMVVGGLKNAVETMTRLWESQEKVATEGRRQVHLKIDALNREVQALTGRVNQMGKDIALIEPSVKVFNDEQLRVEGGKRLGARLLLMVTTAAGLTGWAAHELIGYLFKH